MNRKHVGIVLFNEIEVLDFCGPFEVFSATRLNEEKRRDEPSPFDVAVEYGQHVVSDGRLFTSAGISAGITMALKVAARYYGEDIAQATAAHMEYPFPISNERRVRFQPNP